MPTRTTATEATAVISIQAQFTIHISSITGKNPKGTAFAVSFLVWYTIPYRKQRFFLPPGKKMMRQTFYRQVIEDRKL